MLRPALRACRSLPVSCLHRVDNGAELAAGGAHDHPSRAGIFRTAATARGIISRWPRTLVGPPAHRGRRSSWRLAGCRASDYFAEVAPRLRRVIDYDARCWHTLDPQTRLMTSDAPEELISAGVYTPQTAVRRRARLVASEYLIPDVNTFAGLAARAGAGRDPRASDARPARAERALPRSTGAVGNTARAARCVRDSRARVGRGARRPPRRQSGDFTAARRRRARELSPVRSPMASGPRCASTPRARARDGGAWPGAARPATTSVELITPPARELFAAIGRRPRIGRETLPSPVVALATFVRGADCPGGGGRQRRHRSERPRLDHPPRVAPRGPPPTAAWRS